jgi:hypothetical protein
MESERETAGETDYVWEHIPDRIDKVMGAAVYLPFAAFLAFGAILEKNALEPKPVLAALLAGLAGLSLIAMVHAVLVGLLNTTRLEIDPRGVRLVRGPVPQAGTFAFPLDAVRDFELVDESVYDAARGEHDAAGHVVLRLTNRGKRKLPTSNHYESSRHWWNKWNDELTRVRSAAAARDASGSADR